MQLLIDYIKENHEGSVQKFCLHNNFNRSPVDNWIASGYYCAFDKDGVFRAFNPRQRIILPHQPPAPRPLRAFDIQLKSTGTQVACIAASTYSEAMKVFYAFTGVSYYMDKYRARINKTRSEEAEKNGLGILPGATINEKSINRNRDTGGHSMVAHQARLRQQFAN